MQFGASLGQNEATGMALEQRDANAFFERCNLPGDGRLADTEPLTSSDLAVLESFIARKGRAILEGTAESPSHRGNFLLQLVDEGQAEWSP